MYVFLLLLVSGTLTCLVWILGQFYVFWGALRSAGIRPGAGHSAVDREERISVERGPA